MNDLSQDLQNLIYFDYLQINILNDELNNLLNSNLCQQLNHFELSTMLQNILTHQQFVNYLKQNNRLFNDLYISHIITPFSPKNEHINPFRGHFKVKKI